MTDLKKSMKVPVNSGWMICIYRNTDNMYANIFHRTFVKWQKFCCFLVAHVRPGADTGHYHFIEQSNALLS